MSIGQELSEGTGDGNQITQEASLLHNRVITQNDDGHRVEEQLAPSETDCQALWEVVQVGFNDLNRKAYEKQDMTHEEFMADMRSNKVMKLISYDPENKPLGVLTVHIGLDDVSWTNTAPLQRVQDEHDAEATAYYVGTLVIDPAQRGTQTAIELLQASLLHFKALNAESGHDSYCFFDCCDANYPKIANLIGWCGKTITDERFAGTTLDFQDVAEEYYLRSNQTGEVIKTTQPPQADEAAEVVDVQHYQAFRLSTVS